MRLIRLIPLSFLCFVTTLPAAVRASTIRVYGENISDIVAAVEIAKPGDTVQLAAGAYTMDDTLNLKSGIRLVGAGKDKTVLKYVGLKRCNMISMENAQDIKISDLSLDGASTGRIGEGIHAYNCKQIAIQRVGIHDLTKGSDDGVTGIHFVGDNPTRAHGVTDSLIESCTLERIGVGASFGCGIRMSWGSSRNSVLRCTVRDTGRGGIFADNGSCDLRICNNTVTGSGGERLGIEVWYECDRCIIEDNSIDHWLSLGGGDWSGVRRNTISAKDGSFGFIGIEVICGHCAITDNVVDDGQIIGLSLSNQPPKQYVFYAHNTFRACSQWGAQFQGDAGGIAYQYLYQCKFTGTTIGRGTMIYPSDCGDGFRVNGSTRHMTFEQCDFSDNARHGFTVTNPASGGWDLLGCRFERNKGSAFATPILDSELVFANCVTTANGVDKLPANRAFGSPRPSVSFAAPATARVGQAVTFRASIKTTDGAEPATLWDFGAGVPAQGKSASFTYTRPGAYVATLIVWDKAGRAARAQRSIKVK